MPLTVDVGSPVRGADSMNVLAIVGFYEALAQTVNEALDDDFMPSLTGSIERFSWRDFEQRALPRWLVPAGFAMVGLTLSTVSAARKKRATAGAR